MAELPINQIICRDCIEVMKGFPKESVDMCFADPPFNLGKKYGTYKDDRPFQEYLEWCERWLDEMIRVLTPTGSLFTHQIPRILIHFGDHLSKKIHFRHWIAWDAMGAPLGKTLLPNHYGILYYVKSDNYKFYDVRAPHKRCRVCNGLLADYGGKKDQIHPFGSLVSDVWTDIHRIKHNKRRDKHPCQLPTPLLERLILMATDEGDVVLDPFIGTGTTAIAAKRLGRKYIGIDIDPQYVEITKKKLEKTTPTIINECYVSVFLDKVMSVRDKDYERIENFLKTDKLKINKDKIKQMTLSLLDKR